MLYLLILGSEHSEADALFGKPASLRGEISDSLSNRSDLTPTMSGSQAGTSDFVGSWDSSQNRADAHIFAITVRESEKRACAKSFCLAVIFFTVFICAEKALRFSVLSDR